MRRSSFVASIIALLCVGCAPPKERVFIDRRAALAAMPQTVIPGMRSEIERQPAINASTFWDSSPAQTYTEADILQRVAEARSLIADDRQAALKNLQNSLFDAYTREVERFRLSRNRDITAEAQAKLDEAQADASDILHQYAKSRVEAMVRLAAIVGFPFPPRENVPKPAPERKFQTRQYNVAMDLYAQLDQFEAQFERQMAALFEGLSRAIANQRVALGLEVATQLDEYQQRASREAAEALEETNAEIDTYLINQTSVRLPALPSRSATVKSGEPVVPTLPEVSARRAIISDAEALEADLQIWAGINRYHVVDSAAIGRDRTEQFIQWRKSFQDGRLPK
jgi:hypothetical protein